MKLWAVENWKTNQVNPCAHVVENLASKRDPKISRNSRISWGNRDFPSPKLRFSSLKIWFSSTAFRFPRNLRKSSSTAFQFLWCISTFRNGFLIIFNGFPFPRNLLQRLSAFFYIIKIIIPWIFCQNTHTVNILSFRSELLRTSRSLISIHHTVLQVLKTCMLKWLFN